MHNYLSQVEKICMSNPKEPFFFECEYSKGFEFYREKYFNHYNGEQLIGESRHRNLYLPYVAERLFESSPSAKIIIMVRNPAERAYAHWWHWYARNRENRSFAKAISENLSRLASSEVNQAQQEDFHCATLNDAEGTETSTYVDTGYYAPQIANLLKYFKRDQILVIDNSDLKSNREAVMSEVLNFLGLDSSAAQQINFYEEHNTRKLKKFPNWINALVPSKLMKKTGLDALGKTIRKWLYPEQKPDAKTMSELVQHYEPYNKALGELLNRDFSHWS